MSVLHHILASASAAGFAATGVAAALADAAPSRDFGSDSEQAAELVRRSEQANAALMRGDAETFRALSAIGDDFTLMSPFGGTPTRAADMTPERWQKLGRFFRNGNFRHELVQSWASGDMVVLAVIERTDAEVGGLPSQPWALRVTLVYRRDGDTWRLAHRHADPLVAGISLDKAAALGRGE